MAFAGGFAESEKPVAEGRQLGGATRTLSERRLRGQPAEHREFRDLGIEIDDARRPHRIAHVEIGRARPGVVDIEIDMVAGDHRADRGLAIRGTKNGAMRPGEQRRSFRR